MTKNNLAFKTSPERRVDMPMQTRLAALQPVTLDGEARTVELVWSTGARVRRFDFWNERYYDEELVITPEACDLSRLNTGAPLLDAHYRFALEGQIGVVEKAWIAKSEGRAIVRFSEREAVAGVWQDVKAGIIRNVSVGYAVRKYEIVKEEGQVDIWRAVEWQPMEISLVPVGADAGAGTRAASQGEAPKAPCILATRADAARNTEGKMPEDTKIPAAQPPGDDKTRITPAPADIEAATRAAIDSERKRVAGIRKRADELVKARMLTAEAAREITDDLTERGVALDHVGDHLINEIAKRGVQTTGQPRVEGGADNTDPAVIRQRMTDALTARTWERTPKMGHEHKHKIEMPEASRQYAELGVLEMCAELARARGEKIGRHLGRPALYDRLIELRSLSTSDFPLILANAGNKIMIAAYQLAAPTYRSFAARKRFNDFKPHSFIRGGDFPNLLAVGETGEFKYGAIGETNQSVTLATYGRLLRFSRRVFVNDDMNFFDDVPAKAGRRVADFENATVFAQFALNSGDGPTITETTRPVWNTTDVTKASAGAAIDITTVGAGRAAMMKKKSVGGGAGGDPTAVEAEKLFLNITPRILLTGPDGYTVAQQFVSQNLLPQQVSNVNPFAGALTAEGDANLTGNAWYLFADPAQVETFIYGFLEGAEGPQMFSEEGFTTDGVDFKARLDFVAGAVDYRGTWKNPGA